MSRRYNRAPVEQVRKPTFNVVKPFQGVTMVQLNAEMAKQLADFFDGFDEEDLEGDLRQLQDVLDHYSSESEESLPDDTDHALAPFHYIDSQEVERVPDKDRGSSRIYAVSNAIGGVFAVSVNEAARQLLIEVINECEGQVDRIVWAFRLALEDPTGGPRETRSYGRDRLSRPPRSYHRSQDNRFTR